jgi:uncharacterized protein HemX
MGEREPAAGRPSLVAAFLLGEAFMAVSRDQAARVLRQEAVETVPGHAGSEAATEKSVALAEQLRSHVAEETKRRTNEAPETPVTDKPAAPAAADAPKPGKRKFVLMGVGLVLALAAASYAGYYTLVGRFYVSTGRRLCPRQQHHAGRARCRPHLLDPRRRQHDRARRRRRLPHR